MMKIQNPTHVVVGGGLCGLYTALRLSERGLGSNVLLVERQDGLGGLLRSYDYGENGWFDYGTHYMAETGRPEIDDLFKGLLPFDEWEWLEGNRRDLGGVVYNGRIQKHTPYLDLRSLSPDLVRTCVADFFLNLNHHPELPEATTAGEMLRARFGPVITEQVVDPVLQKLYGRTSEELTPIALRITPLDRVAFADEDVVEDLTKSDRLRARLAYTEQRDLPAERASGKVSFYPKQGGMQRVIDAIEVRLREAGVRIVTEARLSSIRTEGDRIAAVSVEQGGERFNVDVAELYWTVAAVPLLKMLGGELPKMPFDRPPTTAVVNLLLDRPPALDDLFYCYFYDEPLHLFRVANYASYCPAAAREEGVPISVELLLHKQVDHESLCALAERELRETGVLQAGNQVRFARGEVLASGFPMPSVNNARAMEAVRDLVDDRGFRNLTRLGILSEPGIFFQSDVMHQVYREVGRGHLAKAA